VNNEDKAKLRDRARKITTAVQSRHGNNPFSVITRYGEVAFQSINLVTDSEGADYLDVCLLGDTTGGESHFRIYHPPVNIEDPQGTIPADRGRKLREDPIQALAEALAMRGGGRREKNRQLA
jgi:hypothetical protein